jgi:hypothetical protein
MTAGRTVGGTLLYPEDNRLDRHEALRRYTLGSAWFSGEDDKKGTIREGQLADLAVLSADYFSVPEASIKSIESVLTIVDGVIVYGGDGFESMAPSPVPVLPEWSPLKEYGGYFRPGRAGVGDLQTQARANHGRLHSILHRLFGHTHTACQGPLWGAGCECFAI